MTVQTAASVGLRERKKERTRQALIDAAYELFQRKGFDATTVEEIAAAVEVSPRTFFRYFASKEDVALTLQDDLKTALIAELAARPAGEAVMTAIRRAFRAVAQAFQEDDGSSALDDEGGMAQRFTCFNELVSTSPALFAASLEHTAAKLDDVVKLIADRIGADPATDLRPHLVTAVTACAARAAMESWKRAGGGPKSFADGLDQAFCLLEQGLNYPPAPAQGS